MSSAEVGIDSAVQIQQIAGVDTIVPPVEPDVIPDQPKIDFFPEIFTEEMLHAQAVVDFTGDQYCYRGNSGIKHDGISVNGHVGCVGQTINLNGTVFTLFAIVQKPPTRKKLRMLYLII